jgi:hypothetical protein
MLAQNVLNSLKSLLRQLVTINQEEHAPLHDLLRTAVSDIKQSGPSCLFL